MALFEKSSADEFPTEPAFLIPVEVRDTPQYGDGHKGVFAMKPIPINTKFWAWTDRVEKIHHDDIDSYIAEHFGEDKCKIQLFLRQGFVLPGKEKDDYFHSNPTDAGRFMNHSSNPNCGPDGTLRDVKADEELTMDYSFHGNPEWYRSLCQKYDVQTESDIACKHKTT